MMLNMLKSFLARFRDDTRGTITVETVITLPVLFWMIAATYEYFEVYRYKSAREKATYTVADTLSREKGRDVIDDTFIDNMKTLFDQMSNDNSTSQLRVSIVKYHESTDEYSVSWSEVRGTGGMGVLVDADVASAHDSLPIMSDADEIILVESESPYNPTFTVGIANGTMITTRIFTDIRFAPKLCYEGGSEDCSS